MERIIKYPRTRHLQGSKLQPGDEDLSQVSLRELQEEYADDRYIAVFEEKVDGANTAISFDNDGNLQLQCRGHYLRGGAGEKQFALFKQWANENIIPLFEMLEDRYIMYGEWLYAKHTVFYDALPHYFMEFDVYDKADKVFLSTAARRRLIEDPIHSPIDISQVLVVFDCLVRHLNEAVTPSLIEPSAFQTDDWQQTLARVAEEKGQVVSQVISETDMTGLMEGLYIKIEDTEEDTTVDRLKWVRPTFLQAILGSGTHWKTRPILPNQLKVTKKG